MTAKFFNFTLAFYFLSMLFYIASSIFRKKALSKLAPVSLAFGFFFNTLYLIGRWKEAQRPPLANLFESVVFFAWCLSVTYLIVEILKKSQRLGPLASGLATLSVLYASKLNPSIEPLMPALQSNWLTVHVVTCFIGYGAFAIAFLASALYLFKKATDLFLEDIGLKLISFGFIFLTIGIISGAIWANEAWGTYWSWDPKETWSLITWLIYAIFLHGKFVRGWKGKTLAWISVLGFGAVVFTYFGVSFLLSGLHSYI